MKPFKIVSSADQLSRYPRILARSKDCAARKIWDHHEEALDKATKLEGGKKVRLDAQINKVMDRVANQADKKYGDWRAWRHDPRKLRKVVNEIDQAAAKLRAKLTATIRRIEALRKPYIDEMAELNDLHEKLLVEAGCSRSH